MKLNCRRGEATGSGIMYFVFFLMVAMIVGGIYGGMITFFGNGYDYRQTEARVLLKNVRECFDREKFDIANLKEADFYDKCDISEKVIEDDEHMIYIKDKNNKEFFLGVADFKTRCGFNFRFKNKDLPLCASHGKDTQNEDYILVGSSQNSRRVAA